MKQLLLIVFLVTTFTVPSYGQVYRERYASLLPEMIWAHQPVVTLLRDELEDMFEKRDRALGNAANLLSDTSTNNLDVDDDWGEFHQREAAQRPQDLATIWSNAERLIQSSGETPENQERLLRLIQPWLTAIGGQQATLHNMLKGTELALTRDQLTEWRQRYELHSRDLDNIWRDLTSNDRSPDSNANSLRRNLENTCATMSRNLERSRQNLVSYLTGAVPDESEWTRIPGGIESRVSNMINRDLRNFEQGVRSGITGLQSASSHERSLIHMLMEARSSIEEFVNNTTSDNVSAVYAANNNAALADAGKLGPDGDKKDATAYVNHVVNNFLSTHLSLFEAAYATFIDDFEGRFVGPINDATIDEFLERRDWQSWATNIERCRSVAYLRELRDDTNDGWGVNLDDISDEQARRNAQRAVRDQTNRFGRALATARGAAEALEDWATLRYRRDMEELFRD